MHGGVARSLLKLPKEVGQSARQVATAVAGLREIERALSGRSGQQHRPAQEYAEEQMNRARQNINFSENCTCLGALASLIEARLAAWIDITGMPKFA